MSSYRIQSGDTLGALAARFNTTINALALQNGISNPNLIYAGQLLEVSDGFDAPVPGELRLDLMHLALRTASCDVFLLHHVLEYPLDDRLAIAELYRALDPTGVAIATIALDGETETVEFGRIPSIGRRRAYGTRDLAERFRPFAVSVLNVAAELERATRRACGIPPRVHALVLRKTVSCEEGGA